MLGKVGGGRSDRLTWSTLQVKLKKYMAALHESVRGEALSYKGWKGSIPRNIPQQDNTSDCGCFMITFADQEVLWPTWSCPGFFANFCVSKPNPHFKGNVCEGFKRPPLCRCEFRFTGVRAYVCVC